MRKTVSLFTMLVLSCALAFAQPRTVTGQVRDAQGNPVPFATVTEASTKNAVTADANGNFRISISGNNQLTITATGFQNTTVAADNAQNITLGRAEGQMQEVVVTTAFNQRRQARSTGYATATISNSELNQAQVVNPATGLVGKVSGLQIQIADNSVNPNVRINLRGNRSILGNNQALVVVDGILVDNNFLARLNPNDIESFNVLKGASASALYGSDASNGVLVVTTRKGTRGKPRINFSSTTQMETVAYMPKLQERFGSYGGEDPSQILGITFPEDPTKIYFPYENQSFGPEYNGRMVPLGGPVRIFRPDGTFFDSTLMVPYAPVKNGKRNFFDRGMTYQNNVSFSTGDATSLFYFSYQNVRVNGVVPGDNSSRNSIRINGSKQYGRFHIDYNSTYAFEKIDVAGGSYFQDRPVYWTVINAPQHADLRRFRDWRNDPFANPNGYFNAYYGNPWWQIDQSRQVSRTNSLVGNVRLGLDITSWLNASYSIGYTRSDLSYKATKAGFEFAPWAIADPWEAGTIPSSLKRLDPSLTDQISFRDRIQGDALLSANKDFGDFNVKLLLGNTMYRRQARFLNTSTSTLVIPDLYNINYRQGEPNVNEGLVQEGLIGAFADLTIGYKNFLFLHGTARNDWTSKLSPENRRIFYPGVDAAFVFTDAIPALKSNRILNYGKIRAAYTKVGQVNVAPYSLQNAAFSGGGFPFGGQAGFTLSNTFANPDLRPEFTLEKEVGLDLGFLQNRIGFQAAYFDQNTTNQTIPSQISSATGYTGAVVNLGSMRNQGIELDLRLTPLLKLGELRWNMGANFTYIKNRVGLDLPGTIVLGNSVNAVPGQPYPYLRTTDWNRDSASGRIIVDRNTGFPTKANGFTGFGTTVPPYRLGLTTSFNFKGFTLNAVADARFGGIIYNAIGSDLDFTGISWNSAQAGRQPFVIPNSVIDDGTGKLIENTNVATIDGNWRFWANTWNQVGSNYVNSADFWKLRELALTYELPRNVLTRLKVVQAASLTVSGRNLLMWRPKDNVWTDPEFSDTRNLQDVNVNAIGQTNIFQTPPTRIYGATLNVTF